MSEHPPGPSPPPHRDFTSQMDSDVHLFWPFFSTPNPDKDDLLPLPTIIISFDSSIILRKGGVPECNRHYSFTPHHIRTAIKPEHIWQEDICSHHGHGECTSCICWVQYRRRGDRSRSSCWGTFTGDPLGNMESWFDRNMEECLCKMMHHEEIIQSRGRGNTSPCSRTLTCWYVWRARLAWQAHDARRKAAFDPWKSAEGFSLINLNT